MTLSRNLVGNIAVGGPSFPAGESISSGSACCIYDSSGPTLFPYVGITGNSVNVSGFTTSTGGNVEINAKVARLTNTTFALVYSNGTNILSAVVGTIGANNVITYGSVVQISNAFDSAFSVLSVSDNAFVVAHNRTATTLLDIRVCTVSGTVITPQAINNGYGLSGTATALDMCLLGTNKFGVLYRTTSAGVCAFTISGTTITNGTGIVLAMTGATRCGQADTDKFVVSNGSSVRIITVSGTTCLENADFSLGETYTTFDITKIEDVPNVFLSGTISSQTRGCVLNCSGTVATRGATITIDTAQTFIASCRSGNNEVAVSSTAGVYSIVAFNGTVSAVQSKYTLSNTPGGIKGITWLSPNRNVGCVGTRTVTAASHFFSGARKNILGIAQNSASIGQNVTIATTGLTSNSSSGLATGLRYSVADIGGGLTLSSTAAAYVGLSTSSSNIIVGIDYSTL